MTLRKRIIIILGAAFTPSFFPSSARSQCVTCHDFATNGTGFYQSLWPSCSDQYTCFPSGLIVARDFETRLHPGFITIQLNGQLTVSAVIPGSPAEREGVQVGDVVVRINGGRYGDGSCAADGWIVSGSQSARLIVRRSDDERELVVPLVPIGTLLSSAAAGAAPKSASLSSEEGSHSPLGPFVIGIRSSRVADRRTVVSVLLGSPAEKADIRAGDTLLLVDGKRPGLLVGSELEELASGSQGYKLSLRVQRGNSVRDLVIKTAGISELLLHAGLSKTRPSELFAKAD